MSLFDWFLLGLVIGLGIAWALIAIVFAIQGIPVPT